jgi:hypothetical protein
MEGHPLTGLYNHAHNLFLQLLAETGLAGASIAIFGVIVWTRNAWSATSCASGMWIWGCALTLGVHSMLEYPLWNAHFLGIACVVLGLGDARLLALHQARLVRLGLVVFLAGAAWSSAVLLDRYHRLETVVTARYVGNSGAVLEQAHREMMAVRASFFLAPYVDLAYARDIDLTANDIDRKLAFTARVMQFAPTGMVAYRHAALTAMAGKEQQARMLLRQATVAYPGLLDDFRRELSKADTGNSATRAWLEDALRTFADDDRRVEVTSGK